MRFVAIFALSLLAAVLFYHSSWISERYFQNTFIIPEDSSFHPPARPLTAPPSEDLAAGTTELYQTWELSVANDRPYKNPFDFEEISLQAQISGPSGQVYKIDGFFDGLDKGSKTPTWRIRFMANEVGLWTYRYQWSDQSQSIQGSFTVTSDPAAGNHGHVKTDPDNARYLIHDDGTPHYWWGGKWISAQDYGPKTKGAESNYVIGSSSGAIFGHKTQQQLLDYLDLLYRYKHNGLLMKIALYPLEKDRISWDLEWIQRGEWLVREALKRGIYVQINMFDTWSRDQQAWFSNAMEGAKQPFDVWNSGDEALKKNYLRSIVARFAGFANVYWELGNEMEHYPNCGKCFVARANAEYIPWIREFDPYDLPIGLSENAWQSANVDIGFLHQTNHLPALDESRPLIMNELVRTGHPLHWLERWIGLRDGLWQDQMMRNRDWRYMYRKTFWQMFTHGGSGASEATWLNLYQPLNEAAANVMADHWRLREFMEKLPVNINRMMPDTQLITESAFSSSSRSDRNTVFVSYLLAELDTDTDAGELNLKLPSGTFQARWYHPTTGSFSDVVRLGGGNTTLQHPAFYEDLVLLITRTAQ
jgi:hypothetical protein